MAMFFVIGSSLVALWAISGQAAATVHFVTVPSVLPRNTPLGTYSPLVSIQYGGLAPETYPTILTGPFKLQESMKQFDAARGKPVAKGPPTEHRPLGHESAEPSSKDLLH